MHRSIAVGLILLGSILSGCKGTSSDDTGSATSSGSESDSGTTPGTNPGSTSEVTPTSTGSPSGTATEGETMGTTPGTTVETTPSTTEVPSTSEGTGSTGAETTQTASSDGTGGSTGETTGGVNGCIPLMCEGAVYDCGDCMDNDGDGKTDTADPECVSPCDDKEDTFATGLPGDNMDPCKQDCFFDGNSGGGNGDCAWNLKCDPLSPGGDKCPYDPNFNNCPDMQPDECIMNCQVPNGCDCFGCCTVVVDGMQYDIFLGDPDCSLDNIENCSMCSPNEDCDEECHPELCEVCFGQDLPEGCDNPNCDMEMGVPCQVDDMGVSNCPDGEFCNTGCCAPITPQ